MSRVVIAFGSNLGERAVYCQKAIELASEVCTLHAISGLYESEPLYFSDQEPFLNGVFLAETELTPEGLLIELKNIEQRLGRNARERNGPREIDLDIVWMEGVVSNTRESPVIPHPKAHERRFVLEPLNEIAPELLLQGYGIVCELLARPGVQSQKVRRVADAPILI